MRRTGLLGLLVISILTAAIPVQAATEIPTLPAAEAALESEEAADDHAEDAVSSEAVSESEAETLIQETDAEVQTPKDDETAVFADPASIDASAKDSGSELIGDSDLEESTGSVENPEQEEKIELAKKAIARGKHTLEDIAEDFELPLPIVRELARKQGA